ncbi:MAG: glutamine-hydrolyzing carbamoyl-phosphate synthase small subunit [Cyclobacteriaceae bacterium]|nr:glutamine-hydrolyzing carbamoyl-phosphate synthase small subunit [Cyclobacteriaceae bacterium]
MIKKKKKALLLLEDGFLLEGLSVGAEGTSGGEICFNTGMTGYQEIYTDPSYYGQIIINTTAHIGNYGVVENENESSGAKIKGIVVNEFSDIFSRKTGDSNLNDYLVNNNVVGITNIDTRKLVRHIRSKGAMNAIISTELEGDSLKMELEKVPPMANLELSSKVCTSEIYEMGDPSSEFRVAVLDLGVKKSILTQLEKRGCFLRVFPATTTFEEMANWKPTGYFLSNGPGDPAVMDYAVKTAANILDSNYPLFGICLGHQIIARACGIGTYKMHSGHRGLNHPIKNLETGLCEITSQNHGFVVNEKDVEASDKVICTHLHLNDNTIAGIRVKNKPAFSVQYHPEASPGPHDSRYLFDDFISQMKQFYKK